MSDVTGIVVVVVICVLAVMVMVARYMHFKYELLLEDRREERAVKIRLSDSDKRKISEQYDQLSERMPEVFRRMKFLEDQGAKDQENATQSKQQRHDLAVELGRILGRLNLLEGQVTKDQEKMNALILKMGFKI